MKKLNLTILSLLMATTISAAQPDGQSPYTKPTGFIYTPTAENLAAREEFQDMKLGIFIHWGVYSMLADGEWVQCVKKILPEEYAQLPSGFCPSRFNAEEWVKAFKDAGAGYMTITSRHHDGFSMFHTSASEYNIVDATPFKRDVIKELADACHANDLRLHFYYSHLDWHRTDYPILPSNGYITHDASTNDWDSYYAFMNKQITELLTNYGKIGAMWFDGVWDHSGFDWQLEQQYQLIHSLQPQCMVGNNHHSFIVQGEDFQLFEQDAPGENSAGFSNGQQVDKLPLESCQTMNNTWGYSITDKGYKSVDEVIRRFVRCAGLNSNLLLNIGPRPDGKLPDEALALLKALGVWNRQYGESVFGTRGGMIPEQPWGVTTQRDNTLFVHILDANAEESLTADSPSLLLTLNPKSVKRVETFNGEVLKTKKENGALRVLLPEKPHGVDYILRVILK